MWRLLLKAAGPDDIPAELIRFAPPSVVSLLLLLLNFSYKHGVLPLLWRSANVTPLWKGKGAKSKSPSYRAISLTCLFCKLTETILLKRFAPLLSKLGAFQFAYRAGVSAVDALFQLQTRVAEAFDDKSHVSVAFLDLARAFDSAWIDGLLVNVYDLGLTGRAWRWVRAFLSGRRLRVVHAASFSDWFEMLAGTPQGAILSPALFIMFLHSICENHIHRTLLLQLFADDILLAPKSGTNGRAGDLLVVQGLSKVAFALRTWKLILSLEKSNYITFTLDPAATPLPIFIDDEKLPKVASAKYLGLTLTPNLSWDLHFNRVIATTRAKLHSIVSHVTDRFPLWPIILSLFRALVMPSVVYGMPVWAPTTAQSDRLVTALGTGLIKALRVPDSPHCLSVLVDNALLSPRFELAANALRFAHRLQKHPLNPVSSKFSNLYDMPERKGSAKTAVHAVRRAEKLLSLSHRSADFKPSLVRPKAVDVELHTEFRRASLLHKAKLMKLCKVDSGVSPFLHKASRSAIQLIARFRYNRSGLNEQRHKRNPAVSPLCAECKAGSPESVEHVLMQCPHYDPPRRQLLTSLTAIACPLSLNVALGSIEQIDPDHHATALSAVVTFLAAVCALRNL
jgi:hypothetical protein